jgi:hypothetical protein
MSYVVIYKSHLNKNAEVYGPFENLMDAKSWMAQDLGDIVNVLEIKCESFYDWFDDETEEKMPSCGVRNTITNKTWTWEIAEFFER